MKRLFLFLVIAVFFFIFLDAFAYYSFLSPECNTFIEELKEKHRAKEIVSVKEEGIVWIVIIPKNSGVEVKEVAQEAVYSEEGKFEGVYTFTDIIIKNPQEWTRIIWGSATEFYPYDMPRLHFVFDGGELRGIEGFKFNWFGLGIVPAIGYGYYDEDCIYIPTIVEPSSPGDNYTYHQITLPPDSANIPPGTVFPSVGFYLPDDDL
jgi:hypothetical protein